MVAGELVIKLLLNASGFKVGVARAQTDLDALADAGQAAGASVSLAAVKAAETVAGVGDAAKKLRDAFEQAVKEGRELDEISAQAGTLRDELKAAGASAQELEALDRAAKKLGVSLPQATEKSASGFERLASVARRALVVIGGVAVLRQAVGHYYEAADAVGRTADSLGMSVESLQAWQSAAEQAGGSADEMTDRFRDLSDFITDANKLDSGPLKDIGKELGISLKDAQGHARSTEDVLLDLADAFQRVGGQASTGYGMQMSFDPGTIALLQQGRKGLEDVLKRQKELSVYTRQDAENARKQALARQQLNRAWDATAATFARVVSPAITRVTEILASLLGWVSDNKQFVILFFGGLAAVIATAMTPALVGMAAAAWAAAAPFLPFIALAAGLALAIDDLWTFINGGESAFGSLLEWLGLSSQQIEAVRGALQNVAGYLGGVVDLFTALFTLDGDGVNAALEKMFGHLRALKDAFGNLLGYIKDKLLNLLPDWAVELLGGSASESSDTSSTPSADGLPPIAAYSPEGLPMFPMMQASHAAARPAGSGHTDQSRTVNSTTSINSITVQTQATDAQGIVRDMDSAVRNQTAQADGAFEG